MKIKVTHIFILIILTSCVSKSAYDELISQNDSLKQISKLNNAEKDSLKIEINKLSNRLEQFQTKRINKEEQEKSTRFHSEDEALQLVSDYFSFYNADHMYRNPRLRRTSDNKFIVSLEEAYKSSPDDCEVCWTSMVYNLTINNDNTYKLKIRY